MISNAKIAKLSEHWLEISKILYVPRNEDEYQEIVRVLDNLIDVIGEDENHPLASLMEILGILVEKYENELAT